MHICFDLFCLMMMIHALLIFKRYIFKCDKLFPHPDVRKMMYSKLVKEILKPCSKKLKYILIKIF